MRSIPAFLDKVKVFLQSLGVALAVVVALVGWPFSLLAAEITVSRDCRKHKGRCFECGSFDLCRYGGYYEILGESEE